MVPPSEALCDMPSHDIEEAFSDQSPTSLRPSWDDHACPVPIASEMHPRLRAPKGGQT